MFSIKTDYNKFNLSKVDNSKKTNEIKSKSLSIKSASNTEKKISKHHNVEYEIRFNQMDFISKYFNKSTFASDGLCIPLTMKWLSERRTNLETQYFDSLSDKNTHEELAQLKIDVYLEHKKYGQNGVDFITADYIKFKTAKITTVSQKESFPREDGLYAVTFWTPDKKTAHMIGIDINKENKKCTLFDVNHGIKSSANRNAMEKNFIKSNKYRYNISDLWIQKF